MPRYNFTFTCRTHADTPEEAMEIAKQQVMDNHAYVEGIDDETDEVVVSGEAWDVVVVEG